MRGLGTALRVEARKIRSTRTWWILLVVMVPLIAMISGFGAFASTMAPVGADPATDPNAAFALNDETRTSIYTIGVAIGYVFPALIGTLAITTEYRYKTLTSTFLAQPRRGVVLLAKLLFATFMGLVYGVVAIGTSTATGALVLRMSDEAMGLDGDLAIVLLRGVLAMGLWAALGLGLGTLLRNQIAAIIVLLAFSQLVEPLLRAFLPAVEATQSVAQYLPGAAGEAIVGASIYAATFQTDLLPWWQGAAVLGGYALVLFAFGAALTRRRDIA